MSSRSFGKAADENMMEGVRRERRGKNGCNFLFLYNQLWHYTVKEARPERDRFKNPRRCIRRYIFRY